MSETKFQEAKSNLAFSQSLIHNLRGLNRPQIDQGEQFQEEMEQDTHLAPQTPVDTEIEGETAVNGSAGGTIRTIKSFLEEIKDSVEKLLKIGEKEQKEPEESGGDEEEEIEMPKSGVIEEHERLVDVLDSPSHSDDKIEAEKQKEELKMYKKA